MHTVYLFTNNNSLGETTVGDNGVARRRLKAPIINSILKISKN